jgi:FkbM family methyltransferase
MLYQLLGQEVAFQGRKCISVKQGTAGCVLHGPYEVLDPGKYCVIFNISADGPNTADHQDKVCASVDVVVNRARHVSKEMRASQLTSGGTIETLLFTIERRTTVEYRIFSTGVTSLIIDATRRVVAIPPDADDLTLIIESELFPTATAASAPEFFRANISKLRALYDSGARIKIIGDDVVAQISGVSFYANSIDDIWFVDEIFFKGAYNMISGKDCCVIDVGMNIGLTTLFLANKQNVREIHSFEPFTQTYQRALSNITLNPKLSGKIRANNFGLSDRDETRTVRIANERRSGAFSIWGSAHGAAHEISIRDASPVLRPILSDAARKGSRIIGKIDCEGAEFGLFESLKRDNLLECFDAFMVEWHRSIPSMNQFDLLQPLLERNFIAFDTSGKTGNGFFYAVKNS